MSYHTPVLLNESVEGLNIRTGGIYVDVTFGGGGHSREIFKKLSSGKLIVFDQDPDAEVNAADFQTDTKRSFIFVPSNFKDLKRFLKFHGSEFVDGILADLGVSSHQFDVGERGFSTRFDGELDMRMDQSGTLDAKTVLNTYSEKDLIHLLSYYGDIRNARTLASKIIEARKQAAFSTTGELREVAEQVAPKGKREKYLAQLFQAIRIEVNQEMEALKNLLTQSAECLKKDGRLVVISYHSMEDRLVKNFMNTGNFQGKPEKDFYGNLIRPLDPLTRKPIMPDEEEIKSNSRARSARLRIGIKN